MSASDFMPDKKIYIAVKVHAFNCWTTVYYSMV